MKTYFSKEEKAKRLKDEDKKVLIKLKTMIYRNPEEFKTLGVTK